MGNYLISYSSCQSAYFNEGNRIPRQFFKILKIDRDINIASAQFRRYYVNMPNMVTCYLKWQFMHLTLLQCAQKSFCEMYVLTSCFC